jgi:glycosyltransferase involved in cell wall biosynthesis
MTGKKYNILIVTSGSLTLAPNINKLIQIFSAMNHNVSVLSYCDKDLINLPEENVYKVRMFQNRFTQYAISQFLELKAMYFIFKKRRIDLVFFAFGQDHQLVPILFSKIRGKKIILRSDGRPSLIVEKYLEDQSGIKKFFFKIIEYINYHTVDLLVSECSHMLIENRQAIPMHSGVANLPVDTDQFRRYTRIPERSYDLGYFGQLVKRKGIMNLVESVAEIVKCKKDISVIIGSKGEQKEEIVRFIHDNNLEQNIRIIDWIPREKFPDYLNSVRVFILPSALEGLPNTVLEAMACGAVVLSTPVGGIPDVIIDGVSGFIMENNSVPCITKNIQRVLNYPELERIADNAQAIIKKEYSFEFTLYRYSELLEKI